MSYLIPKKDENPVCRECGDNRPEVHDICEEPCNHLVSWAGHEARAAVNREARASTWAIRNANEREELRGDF